MIRLKIRKVLWSKDEASQRAYEHGRIDQAEDDAEGIREWLVQVRQEIEIVDPPEETNERKA